MEKMKIANAHTHIFPSKIAGKAVKAIGDFYDLHMGGGGTSETLIKDGAASPLRLTLDNLSDTERGILKLGSLMNYYASPKSKNKE